MLPRSMQFFFSGKFSFRLGSMNTKTTEKQVMDQSDVFPSETIKLNLLIAYRLTMFTGS